MGAPVPSPQYIDYDTNIKPLIGTDKILVSDTDSTGIPTSQANALIAAGESLALEDLSPYYVTDPALITISGGDWTTLPPYTYNIIYNMFVYQASIQLIGAFIARNTDEEGRTLSFFQKDFATEYAKIINRLVDLLPNGGYKYVLTGLQPLVDGGIKRRYRRSVTSGRLGACNYTDRQLTNPQTNFSGGWPIGWWWSQ
jgi:hypothetical protein